MPTQVYIGTRHCSGVGACGCGLGGGGIHVYLGRHVREEERTGDDGEVGAWWVVAAGGVPVSYSIYPPPPTPPTPFDATTHHPHAPHAVWLF